MARMDMSKKAHDKRVAAHKKTAAAKKGTAAATGADLERQRMTALLDSSTAAKFGPTERALGNEIARTGAHAETIDNVYAAYQRQVADLAAQQQAAMQQAAQAQAQVAQGVAGGQAALGAEQAGRAQETAARYGLDSGQQAQQLAGQLGAVNGARAQAQAGTTAAIGLGQHERLAAASVAGIGGQQRDRQHNQAELAMLGQKQIDLAGQKGDFRVTYGNQLSEQDRQNRLAEKALGVKDADAQRQAELDLLGLQIRDKQAGTQATLANSTLQDRKDDNARADAKLTADIKKNVRAAAQKDRELDIRARKDGKDSKAGGLTDAQKNTWKQRKARVLEARKRFNSMVGSGRYKDTAEVSVALKKAGFKDPEINMARDLAQRPDHRLSPLNETAAQSYFPGGVIPQGFLTDSLK